MEKIKSRLKVLLGILGGVCIAFVGFVDNIEYLTSSVNWLLIIELIKFFKLEIILFLSITLFFGTLHDALSRTGKYLRELTARKKNLPAILIVISFVALCYLLGEGLWQYANIKTIQWQQEPTGLLLEAWYDASSGQLQRAKNTLTVCEKLYGDSDCSAGLRQLNDRNVKVQQLKDMRNQLYDLDKDFNTSVAIYHLNGDEKEILGNCAMLNKYIVSLSSTYSRMIDELKSGNLVHTLTLCDSINDRFWSFGNCHVLKEELTLALSNSRPLQPLVYLTAFKELDKERILKIELSKYTYDCDSIFGINEQKRYGIRP